MAQDLEPAKDLQKEDRTFTESEVESNEYLLRKYFLEANSEEDTEVMRHTRQDRREFLWLEGLDICEEEVIDIIRTFNSKKAVCDKIPNEAMMVIYEAVGDEFLDLYKLYWENGVFPKV